MENITLTAEELELIKAKREKDVEAAKTEEEKRYEECLKDMKHSIDTFTNTTKRLNEAIIKYAIDLEALSNKVVLKREQKIKTFDASYWDSGKEETIVLKTEDIQYEKLTITYGDAETAVRDECIIEVKEHRTYGNSAWSSVTNHGYKMFIDGLGYEHQNRPYKSSKSIIKKIKELLAIRKTAEERGRQKLDTMSEAIELLQERYPEAEIEKTDIGKHDHKGKYNAQEAIKVKTNKVSLQVRAYRNIEGMVAFTFHSVVLADNQNSLSVMDVLMTLDYMY